MRGWEMSEGEGGRVNGWGDVKEVPWVVRLRKRVRVVVVERRRAWMEEVRAVVRAGRKEDRAVAEMVCVVLVGVERVEGGMLEYWTSSYRRLLMSSMPNPSGIPVPLVARKYGSPRYKA